ncbi:MAG: hypothetical protein IH860_08070, partial [Chloroflexi bacterium]|nr:hypothetical protein [Chloroflexota bacterium]
MALIQQPDGDPRLGDVLVNCFQGDTPWPRCRIAVAFLKRSGLRHIEEPLRQYVSRGGQLEFIIGVDHAGTSREGLELLLSAVGGQGQLWIFHNDNPSTFHPKVYLFSSDHQALLVIGSGNLTEGGLYTNYEVGAITELDLSLEQDQRLLREVNAFMDGLLGQSALVVELSQESLADLVDKGYVVSEERSRNDAAEETPEPTSEMEEVPDATASLFARAVVKAAPRPQAPPPRVQQQGREQHEAPPPAIQRGMLLWWKELPHTDAQRQTGNVTGVLRLSSTGFRVNGQPIHSSEYFRHTIFSDFHWEITQDDPIQEATHVRFRVLVLGNDWGEHQLRVSHQPSRV